VPARIRGGRDLSDIHSAVSHAVIVFGGQLPYAVR
jgi:hypothetical protein